MHQIAPYLPTILLGAFMIAGLLIIITKEDHL